MAEVVGGRPLLAAIDRHIESLYGIQLRNYLNKQTDCRGYFLIDGSEKGKNWEQVQRLCDEAIRLRMPRDGVILAVGGGVTLDVAGFAASIFRRGIRYVRVPTSLIALVDVAVGIKHGINAQGSKNILGSFYPAAANINDITFLSTLPEAHLACGIAEIIKMAVIRDEELFGTLERHVRKLLATRFQGLAVARYILLRAEHLMTQELQQNLFELNTRRLPDFGHSFSPIIEAASLYSIAHGEAVAIDMLLSTTIAVNRGLCPQDTLDRLRFLLIAAGLPLTHDVSVIGDLGFGGGEIRLLALARNIDRDRFDHTVMTIHQADPDREETCAMRRQFAEAGVKVRDLGEGYSGAIVPQIWQKGAALKRRVRKLCRVIKQLDIDVVDAHLEPAALVGVMAAMITGRASAVTLYHPEPLVRRRFWRLAQQFTLGNAGVIITDSDVRGREIQDAALLRKPKVVVIPNGISRPEASRSPAEMRDVFGLPHDPRTCVIGQISALVEFKGHMILLKRDRCSRQLRMPFS